MKTYAFLAGIAISMIISAANAQTVNPDSFLGTDQNMEQNVPPQNNQPEAPSAPNPPTPPIAYDLPMTAKCWPMGYLKMLLERAYGQVTYAIGFNGKATLQQSPFDGMIIARNPLTFDYTVVIVSTENNMACVVAMGTELHLKSEQNTE